MSGIGTYYPEQTNTDPPVSPIELRPVILVRSCFRCGKEFRRDGGTRICPSCRAPKRGRKLLNRKLSFREKQIIDLICQAKLNKEIAYELHLTEGTIKEYLNRLFRKLQISNRTELAVWALTNQMRQVDECA